MPDPLSLLRQLMGIGTAQAEVLPQDQEAVDLLNALSPEYAGILTRAQNDPRQARVWAGPTGEVASELGGLGATTANNNIYIGAADIGRRPESEWIRSLPLGEERRKGVLAHELGHFIDPTQQFESLIDLLARNPADPQLDYLQHDWVPARGQPTDRIRQTAYYYGDPNADFGRNTWAGWLGADPSIESAGEANRKTLLDALGEYARTFMGPIQPKEAPRFSLEKKKKGGR